MINWEDINTKGKISGTTKVICPNCSHTRKKKKDPCLYVNLDSGVAKCFNCENLAFRDGFKESLVKNYTLPSQEWRNYTKLSENLVKWFEEKRGIKQFTLNHFEISEELVYQPAIRKSVNSISFNYFEGISLVNKKFRDGAKNFTQTKGGKPILYNINSLIGADEAWITEGEIDVLSFWQIGIKNVVSIPNGANDNDDYWINSEPYLKDINKFYIATDNDEKGDIIAEKISHRLGKYRCERVKFVNKDANEDLIAGVLEKDKIKTEDYPVSGTIKHSDILDKMKELKQNGVPKTIKPKSIRFYGLNYIFSLLLGQLTVITGIPSHGKSNFLEDYIISLSHDYDFKISLFSPEHNPSELHAMNLASKAMGRNSFKSHDNDINNYVKWANERIYFTVAEKDIYPEWDWLFDTFKAQMMRFGINIFVIDAWNKVVLKVGDKAEIDRVITRLASFAQSNNVLIFLVAHPTKMKKRQDGKFEIPDLYDVSGSADFKNQTHNGLCVYRDFEENTTMVINLKTKFSFQGEIGGSAKFKYNIESSRYCDIDQQEDNVSYVDNTMLVTLNKEYEIPKLDPTKAFFDQVVINENDEIPF